MKQVGNILKERLCGFGINVFYENVLTGKPSIVDINHPNKKPPQCEAV